MTDPCKGKSRTWSVSLILDPPSAEKILSAQKELAQITKNDHLVQNPPPPHITLGFFHATDEDFPQLKALFGAFANSAGHTFEIAFGTPDSFLGKVIFLPVKKDSQSLSRLKALNSTLHEKFSAYEPGANRNYTPERFFPHTALAVKLTKEQFEKGMNWACRLSPSGFPGFRTECSIAPLRSATADAAPTILHAKAIAVSLAETHPYKELSRIALHSFH